MKIIYKEGTRKTLTESTDEARSTVAKALELVEGKHGFRTPFEIWRNVNIRSNASYKRISRYLPLCIDRML